MASSQDNFVGRVFFAFLVGFVAADVTCCIIFLVLYFPGFLTKATIGSIWPWFLIGPIVGIIAGIIFYRFDYVYREE